MNKRALITGITGQDGAYLAKLLLDKGYQVVGTSQQGGSADTGRLAGLGIEHNVEIKSMNMLDPDQINRVLDQAQPDEIYNLAGQSSVAASFKDPLTTGETTGMGAVRVLEAIRSTNSGCKFYQASSSEMFGHTQSVPQNEKTPFNPCSPYAAAKLYAHVMTVSYREAYGMFCCTGILFNHESPLRGLQYVTRKITHTVAQIKYGLARELRLGNLDVKRDWGYAPEYVEAMWLMMQQQRPDDYVIATGETHSVREFVAEAFDCAGLDWEKYVVVDSELYRPAEINLVIGDPSKAARQLKWRPRTGFDELVGIMVDADLKRVERQKGGNQ